LAKRPVCGKSTRSIAASMHGGTDISPASAHAESLSFA
jgi:hypothetical protein